MDTKFRRLVMSTAVIAFSHGSAVYAGSAAITGRLIEKGSRKPLTGVNVFCLPAGGTALKGVTGEDGNFRIESVPEGEFRWVVNLTGYERLESPDSQAPGAEIQPRTLRLEKTSYQVYETTVYGSGEKRDSRTKSSMRFRPQIFQAQTTTRSRRCKTFRASTVPAGLVPP